MLVLHAHWQPPADPRQQGTIFFWAEYSSGQPLTWKRASLSKNPRAKAHPFCAPPDALQPWLPAQPAHASATGVNLTLRLPTSRTGPLPSPRLPHSWDLDRETPPILSPWKVAALRLPLKDATLALLDLSSRVQAGDHELVLGHDFLYWAHASALALETLAAHKVFPLIVQADEEGERFHARWLPVLDTSKDHARLAALEAAMPPVCRAEAVQPPGSQAPSPRALLVSYLNSLCDCLMRQWGGGIPALAQVDDLALQRWLAALVSPDPAIKAAANALRWLAASHKTWMRNLQAAGDAAFQVAFRLEAPVEGSDQSWGLSYLLQARDDPSLLIPAQEVWKKNGSALQKLGRRFEQPQEKMLAGLGYAARIFPPLRASLQEKRPARVQLDTAGAYHFLRQAAPLLEGAGFGLLAPPWWNQRGARLGLRLKMRPREKQEANAVGRVSMQQLIDYQWELSVGETTLSEDEFRALAALKSPLVQVRGQWVTLDPEQVEAAIQFWQKQQAQGEMGLLDAMQHSLAGEDSTGGLPVDEVAAEGWLAGWLEQVSETRQMAPLPQPAGLHGQLRPYQQYGFSWLGFLREWGLGACLADDMGLGKTIQTIALLLHEKDLQGGRLSAPVLLVAPTSVVTNWQRELQKFAPGLSVYIHRGADRQKEGAFQESVRAMDVVLTSYPVLRRDSETFQHLAWQAVILDEAQNIKNPTTRQAQAVRRLQAGFRIALTGTPVENRLSELWSIMHFLNPGYLGSREQFRKQFALPIERYQDSAALDRMRKLVSPFILRRVKTDPSVITDLPEKVETRVYCTLTEEQATLYEAVVQDAMRRIEGEEEGIGRRGLVLSMLMQLKQICNHPVQYLHEASRAGEGAQDAVSVLERSGKLQRLVELLEEVLAAGERALVFTQFAEMGHLLAGSLPSLVGASTQFLHGGTPAKTRDHMVQSFQEQASAPPIFILSLKAGGTGLNLTRASHVFHFDRWWNPAVEDQATDRAFRIGQRRNVQVHKFVTSGTLEEMIDEMIEDKKALAQSVVGSGENWLTELSTADLHHLVRLRSE